MQIHTHHDSAAGVVTISVPTRFDISLTHDFLSISRHLPRDAKDYVVDMAGTNYIDAAALGCLMIFWDEKPVNSRMSVINCNMEIMQILTVGAFDKLFSVTGDTMLGNTTASAKVA